MVVPKRRTERKEERKRKRKGKRQAQRQRLQRQAERQRQVEEQGERKRQRKRMERLVKWSNHRHAQRAAMRGCSSEGSDSSDDGVILRRFMKMMRGATLADYTWLLRMDILRSHVYVYDHELKSVRHPDKDADLVSWPIIWMLGRYNRKHTMVNQVLPSSDFVRNDVINFTLRQGWRWILQNALPNPPPAFQIKFKKNTPLINQIVDPALTCWSGALRHRMACAVQRARSFHRYHRSYSNQLPVIRFARKLLAESGLVPVLTDKDGGYALEPISIRQRVHEDILSKEWYKEIPYCTISYENSTSEPGVCKVMPKDS